MAKSMTFFVVVARIQVDEDFIQDDFNLCSLATQVTYYNYALGTFANPDLQRAAVPTCIERDY